MNELSSMTKKYQKPTVYIVSLHQTKLRFESLKLIDNCMYVRTHHEKIKAPKNPEEIKDIFAEIPQGYSERILSPDFTNV